MRILIPIILVLFVSCATSKSKEEYKTMEFISGYGKFQLLAPSNWTYQRVQGIDSYVGNIITKEKDTLCFDMGRYSNSLSHYIYRDGNEDDDEESYKSKVTRTKINGYNAKFASHWKKSKSDYGVYFDSLWTDENSHDSRDIIKLTIYGFNLSKRTKKQLKTAVQSIKFKQK
jgi:hypothetical protein